MKICRFSIKPPFPVFCCAWLRVRTCILIWNTTGVTKAQRVLRKGIPCIAVMGKKFIELKTRNWEFGIKKLMGISMCEICSGKGVSCLEGRRKFPLMLIIFLFLGAEWVIWKWFFKNSFFPFPFCSHYFMICLSILYSAFQNGCISGIIDEPDPAAYHRLSTPDLGDDPWWQTLQTHKDF